MPFRLLVLLATTTLGCRGALHPVPPPTPAPHAAETAGDPDAVVPEGWFDGALPESENIDAEAARSFVDAVFALVERKLFDPAFKEEERAKAHRRALAALEGRSSITRREVRVALDDALKTSGMSHLRLIGPEKGLQLFTAVRSAEPADAAAPTVEIERAGDVAIVRVHSFLVPEITLVAVAEAMTRARGAKALVLDLRGNGGGSTSSRVYLAQYLLGPGKTVVYFRGRTGAGRAESFRQDGFFPDERNTGSEADVALNAREGFVEWRTPARTPPTFDGRAYLLVDHDCASACDSFAAAMKDHHGATLLGTTTRGELLSASAFRSAWRGYLVLVPVGMELSPLQKMIEGVGVSPDVELSACAEKPSPEGDPCLRAALDHVRAQLLLP